MAALGAQRKQVTFPTDFRSQPENGRSRYGHRTARFAPQLPLRIPIRRVRLLESARANPSPPMGDLVLSMQIAAPRQSPEAHRSNREGKCGLGPPGEPGHCLHQ
jgi:hypothetical protein